MNAIIGPLKLRIICVRLLLVAAVTFSPPGCGKAPLGRAVPDEPLAAGIALASFDSLWTVVQRTYVDTAFVRGRWVSVRDSLRPWAERISTRNELNRLFAETLGTIGDSHFYIIPAHAVSAESAVTDGRGSTGLEVRLAEGRVVAWRVKPRGPAEQAGIRPGDAVGAVGGIDVSAELRRLGEIPEVGRQKAISDLLRKLNGRLTPASGDSVTVVVEGKARRLVAVPAEGRLSKYANLPPIAGIVKWNRLPLSGGGCAGVVSFNVWLPAFVPDLERAVDSVRACRGIVVDLRGNPGGLGGMVMGFGGYFVDSVRSLGKMQTREVALNFVINPRNSRSDGSKVSPWKAPVAILTDALTGSTSEIFAAGMQRIGRARVFGERSAGAALPALARRLPSGDVFVHAIADFTDPDGKRIEGAGVIPDEEIPLKIASLRSGEDAPLDAAVRWIIQSSVGR